MVPRDLQALIPGPHKCLLTWQKGLCRCDEAKDPEISRCSLTVQCGPEARGYTAALKMEEGAEAMNARNVALEAGRGQGTDRFFPEIQRARCQPSETEFRFLNFRSENKNECFFIIVDF